MLPVSSINNLFISPQYGNDMRCTTMRIGIPRSWKLLWDLELSALWPSEVKSQIQANPARGLSCQPHTISVPKGEMAGFSPAVAGRTRAAPTGSAQAPGAGFGCRGAFAATLKVQES